MHLCIPIFHAFYTHQINLNVDCFKYNIRLIVSTVLYNNHDYQLFFLSGPQQIEK